MGNPSPFGHGNPVDVKARSEGNRRLARLLRATVRTELEEERKARRSRHESSGRLRPSERERPQGEKAEVELLVVGQSPPLAEREFGGEGVAEIGTRRGECARVTRFGELMFELAHGHPGADEFAFGRLENRTVSAILLAGGHVHDRHAAVELTLHDGEDPEVATAEDHGRKASRGGTRAGRLQGIGKTGAFGKFASSDGVGSGNGRIDEHGRTQKVSERLRKSRRLSSGRSPIQVSPAETARFASSRFSRSMRLIFSSKVPAVTKR